MNSRQDARVAEIAKMIDHTVLKPELTLQDTLDGCAVAKQYNVASLCVRPCDVSAAAEALKGTGIPVGCTIGFPHGANKTEIKVQEALAAIADGAEELDMVLNIGRLIAGDLEYVKKDIAAVVAAAHAKGVLVKVILENCFLNDEQKASACRICEEAGADYVKTSTGFGSGGSTMEDLELMRNNTTAKVKIKAAGGVFTWDAALQVREKGASRIGTIATRQILEGAR